MIYSNIPLKYRIAMEALRMIAFGEVKATKVFAATVRRQLLDMPNNREEFFNIEIDKNGHISRRLIAPLFTVAKDRNNPDVL